MAGIGDKRYFSNGASMTTHPIAISAVPGLLMQIGGHSPENEPTAYYVQLFNLLPAAVVNGVIPFQEFFVPIGASFSWEPSLDGHEFGTALSFGISSTPGVFTDLATASLWLFAEYIVT